MSLDKLIQHNVPRYIKFILDKGGVTEEDFRWLRSSEVEEVMERADSKLLYPTNADDYIQSVRVLAIAIAIMSFSPGGIHIFDYWFSPHMNNYFESET